METPVGPNRPPRSKRRFFGSFLPPRPPTPLTFLHEAAGSAELPRLPETRPWAQVQQESSAKKPRLHCGVDSDLITSTPPNANSRRRAIGRVGRRGSLNGRE